MYDILDVDIGSGCKTSTELVPGPREFWKMPEIQDCRIVCGCLEIAIE